MSLLAIPLLGSSLLCFAISWYFFEGLASPSKMDLRLFSVQSALASHLATVVVYGIINGAETGISTLSVLIFCCFSFYYYNQLSKKEKNKKHKLILTGEIFLFIATVALVGIQAKLGRAL